MITSACVDQAATAYGVHPPAIEAVLSATAAAGAIGPTHIPAPEPHRHLQHRRTPSQGHDGPSACPIVSRSSRIGGSRSIGTTMLMSVLSPPRFVSSLSDPIPSGLPSEPISVAPPMTDAPAPPTNPLKPFEELR